MTSFIFGSVFGACVGALVMAIFKNGGDKNE